MDEKRIAELRKFIGLITDPKVCAFIDLKKLCNSGMYNLSVQMATEHAARHGDFGLLNRLFGLLEGTAYANEFVSDLRSKLSFVLTNTKPRKLKKATPEEVTKAAKHAAALPVFSRKPQIKPSDKKDKPRTSHDLMDSRLMLPGSYGMGRRR